jgi:hypothetical protein
MGFFGIWGCGLFAWKHARLPQPWYNVTGAVSGVLLFGLGCQVIAAAGIATRLILGLYLFFWVSIGLVWWCSTREQLKNLWSAFHPWMLLFLIPAGVLLVMAMSGSTKIDELYYHMLVPARIVAHEELVFFGYPWQAAVPQMAYQIAQAPFHAIGYPHAGNIISWMLAMVLAFFAHSLVKQRHSSDFLASAVAAILVVGMYPMVWYVTGGAHSFGDLAVASAVIACTCFRRAPEGVHSWVWTGAVSTLLVAGAVTKISLLPLLSILWLCLLWRIRDPEKGASAWHLEIAAASVPWLLFYVPMPGWTWINSGSPFGPVLAGTFGESVYSPGQIKTVLERSELVNRQYRGILPLAVYPHSVLLVAASLIRALPRTVPAIALGLQVGLILAVLPWDLRFLGGTQLAVVILTGMYVPRYLSELIVRRNTLQMAIVLCLVPWFGLQLYYVAPFASVVAGFTTQTEFYDRYIAFHRDFQQLDDLLPQNAVILTTGVRPDAVYFPRAVAVNRMDVVDDRPVYLFACSLRTTQLSERIPDSHRVGELIYENPDALISASRVPGVPSKRGRLQIYQLVRNDALQRSTLH